jgi:multidrug efflux pump subunit AcrB
VINDSLVLVHYVNQQSKSLPIIEAAQKAGMARFRPILLTSLTTFVGLLPILFERSLQAQFLKPMAIAIGFGVLFATFITLLMVPCLYLILEDLIKIIKKPIAWMSQGRDTGKPTPLQPNETT